MTAHILVVDDEEFVREEVADSLDYIGYQVSVAADIAGALVVLQENPDIHVVITDYRMPKETGFDLIKRVKQAIPRPIRYVILSGHVSRENTIDSTFGQWAEVTAVVRKPAKIEALVDAIRGALAP